MCESELAVKVSIKWSDQSLRQWSGSQYIMVNFGMHHKKNWAFWAPSMKQLGIIGRINSSIQEISYHERDKYSNIASSTSKSASKSAVSDLTSQHWIWWHHERSEQPQWNQGWWNCRKVNGILTWSAKVAYTDNHCKAERGRLKRMSRFMMNVCTEGAHRPTPKEC
jgi:hypothetical protein